MPVYDSLRAPEFNAIRLNLPLLRGRLRPCIGWRHENGGPFGTGHFLPVTFFKAAIPFSTRTFPFFARWAMFSKCSIMGTLSSS